MKRIQNLKKLGYTILIVNLVYFIIYNWYFGWNMFPESTAEFVCDSIASVLWNIGIYCFILVYTIKFNETFEKNKGLGQ